MCPIHREVIMQIKLESFERNKDQVSQDTLNLLKEIFKQPLGWDKLIKYINDREKNPDFLSLFREEDIYEFVFEYAIQEGEEDFIWDLVNHTRDGGIIKYLKYKVLYHYAKTQDDYFQLEMIAFMVKNDPYSSDYPSIRTLFSDEIRFICRELGRGDSLSAQEVEKLEKWIGCFLKNKNLSSELLYDYYTEWVRHYVYCLGAFESNAAIKNLFLKFLPNDKKIRAFWVSQIATSRSEKNLKEMLSQHDFSQEEIEMAIYDRGDMMSLSVLGMLVEKLDADHPIKNYFHKMRTILTLNSAEKRDFIMMHQDTLFGDKKFSRLIALLKENLKNEDRILLISYITQDPRFPYSDLFTGFIYQCDDELVCRYLQESHTKIPMDFLCDMVDQEKRSNLPKIIAALLSRNDYKYEPKIFRSLYALFLRSDLNSIEILLNHSEIFLLLKNYYNLKGDQKLRREDHGLLMPLVLSWYLWKAKAKAVELFLNLNEKQRSEISKGFVPRYIDSNEITLRAFILQLGIPELIEAVGGLNPRHYQKSEEGKLVPIVSNFWKNPEINRTLIKMQRKTFIKHARKQSENLHFSDKTHEAQLFGEKAAAAYDKKTIYLQHQTKFLNSEKILSLGYLRTRAQIENTMLGQASGGLTVPSFFSNDPGNSFIYLTRLPDLVENQEKTIQFEKTSLAEQTSFILNGPRLLAENPHINFVIIGPYPFFDNVKKLKLSNEVELISNPSDFHEHFRMKLVEFNHTNFLFSIYKTLFVFVFDHFICRLDEPLKSEIIQKLTEPSSEEDKKLATDFINLLHLEWLIPGNLPLKLSYVERVDYGENKYSLSELRKILQEEEESKVLVAIRQFKGFESLPFVVNDVINIALKRKQPAVVREMVKFLKDKPNKAVIYYPDEVYEIESLAQLILEDLNDNRVYLHWTGNKLLIHSTLRKNSHHGGAHHAEMAKLHFALGVGSLANQNALATLLEDNLTISVGENETFKSLLSVRDALLTFEITTLLTSYQNQNYYEQHNGDFHPITGKGAANGKVALLNDRLYKDGSPYHVQVSYNKDTKSVEIKSSLQEMLPEIAKAIREILTIASDKFIIQDNKLVISMTAWDFIAKLRQAAIFYEGINVITEEGELLLAYRHGRGLASAGGHHSDKYSPKGIGHGLHSEFSLTLNTPASLTKEVLLMNDTKFSLKTGIYILPYNVLLPTKEAKSYAFLQNKKIPFKADPEEFQVGSEVALTLSEMRGKYFYDVMPIAELCQYQLNKLKETLSGIFPKEFQDMSITIDHTYEVIVKTEVSFKIPSETFGRMCFSTSSEFPQELKAIVESFKVKSEDETGNAIYLIDASPFVLLKSLAKITHMLSVSS